MNELVLSVFEGGRLISESRIGDFGKQQITFGSAPDNDIVIAPESGIVSRHHGRIAVGRSSCSVADLGSTNGLQVNGAQCTESLIGVNDVISIGNPKDSGYDAIVMLFHTEDERWMELSLRGVRMVTIGRDESNNIVLPSPAVSAQHAVLQMDGTGQWVITDNNSFNGTFVNGKLVEGPVPLASGDVIMVANITLLFEGDSLLCAVESRGVELIARDLVQIRKTKGRDIVTNDHVSLHIGKGQLVSIVGGSGSGKTTLLNELNGADPAKSGSVTIDGIDLYSNYAKLKNSIGYVPQQDIVYDDLRLFDMLLYAAELRMPPDTSKADREKRAEEVLEMLELTHVRDNFIGRLSGGQKKRASIAVELLADPRLLFLDEPTSGLDPGIEQSLMRKLASMAHEGRTIILVTHTTLNLDLCDQVVFLAPGGKLCYAGDPSAALGFFEVDDFVAIYDKVAENPDGWAQYFEQVRRGGTKRAAIPAKPDEQSAGQPDADSDLTSKKNPPFGKQLSTLCRRYAQLVINDKQRLALLILQAPILAALICLVAGEDCFNVFEDTQSCLFALSCAAFWVGMLDSIQEICKERVILQREYAGGLNIVAYVLSKIIVLGILCVVQSALLTIVFCAIQGVPDESLINAPLELFVTMFLSTFSAMCLGLFVSALFKNPDRAIAMAPILIMPQILFSGLVFKLEGFAENISAFVNCKWSMDAFGTTANLNALDLKIYDEQGISPDLIEHEWDSAFDYTVSHLAYSWEILGLFCLVCSVLCGIVLWLSVRKRG